jgi:hypothetical protein
MGGEVPVNLTYKMYAVIDGDGDILLITIDFDRAMTKMERDPSRWLVSWEVETVG